MLTFLKHLKFQDDPTAYLGITVPNFPNFFLILGPNGVVGHNSATVMIECQANYISDCIAQMIKSGRSKVMNVRSLLRLSLF
jgi:cation diffusion facilitator CzcD-associated flavoprotein CzcO